MDLGIPLQIPAQDHMGFHSQDSATHTRSSQHVHSGWTGIMDLQWFRLPTRKSLHLATDFTRGVAKWRHEALVSINGHCFSCFVGCHLTPIMLAHFANNLIENHKFLLCLWLG